LELTTPVRLKKGFVYPAVLHNLCKPGIKVNLRGRAGRMGKSARYRATPAFTALIIFLLLAEWVGLFNSINTLVDSVLPSGGPFVSAFTDTASFASVTLYVLAFLLWDVLKQRKLSGLTLDMIFSLFIAMVMVGLLKVLTGVPRPGETGVHWSLLESLRNADYFAFPSGHTTRASILASFLSERFPGYKALWWGYAILIALSRLFLHVHWLSDVLFGLLLGPWVFMLVECTRNSWLPLYKAVIKKLGLEVLDVE